MSFLGNGCGNNEGCCNNSILWFLIIIVILFCSCGNGLLGTGCNNEGCGC